MTWILILFTMGTSYNTVAVTNVSGFKTEKTCLEAGKKSFDIAKGYYHVGMSFACVKQ